MRQIHNLIFFLFMLSPMSIAFGLPEDSNKIIHIVANSTEFNYKTGTDIYEGDVQVDQGTTHLKADRLVTQKDENHKIISAIAYGNDYPAEYSTIPKLGDLLLKAKAKVITYYPRTSTIFLKDNVIVTQGGNSFRGTNIIYNMKDQTVSAPASKHGRASIVIEPKQLKS